ncbi:MAG: metallophosphoesterase, partial [Planctomycetaceae bacterium]
VVMSGDIAYENGKDARTFLQFFVNYSRDLRDEKGRLIPLLGGIGNHEVNGGYGNARNRAPFFYAMFDGFYPETGYNVIDFGDYMSLIFLDTGHTNLIEGRQTDWLEKTLKVREEFPTVFVFYHVPSYPSVRPPKLRNGDEGTGKESRKHWVPLFERYNVDAVFEHHDHAFKRTHPLLDGMKNENGIVYLGDGSWGKIRRPEGPDKRPYLALSHEAYHLSWHRVEGEDRHHVALSETGKIVDVTMTKKRSHRRTK